MKPTLVLLVALSAAKCIPVPAFAADTPANLAAVRARPTQHGPFRTDPAQGVPKHAYSPFDKLNQPPPYKPRVGRDFLPGKLVIKLKPAGPASSKLVGAAPNVNVLQQKFASYGVTELERVFPNVQPPAQNLLTLA